MTDRVGSGPSDYLAAERTFLAWIRTGLALMGFGFVVARFGLFLRAMQIGQPGLPVTSYGVSAWFGTALILLGVAVNVFSTVAYLRTIRRLRNGELTFTQPSMLAIGLGATLALLGLGIAIYLLSVRDPQPAGLTKTEETFMTPSADNGIVTLACKQTVDETVRKLEGILAAKGIKLFALVDHSGEAEAAGLHMRPTKLLVFGSPKAGTPVMIASPSIAIDLPLKILVWEDADGKAWISYNSPAYLQSRHAVPAELVPNIAVISALAKSAAE